MKVRAGRRNFPLKTAPGSRIIPPMRIVRPLFLLLATLALTGCNHADTPPDTTLAPSQPGEPTHAQAKLPTIHLFLGAETLDAEQAVTPEQEMTGMMFRTNIQDSDSMLFVLPVPQRASFWMKNCPESISCAYISPDGIILEIHHLEKNDTNAVLSATENIQYVLETSDGWFTRHHVGVGTAILSERGSLFRTYFQ